MAARFLYFNKFILNFPSPVTGRFLNYKARRDFSSIRNVKTRYFKCRRNFVNPTYLTNVRFMSSSEGINSCNTLTDLEAIPSVVEQLSEPTLASLGLAGNTPVGLIQQVLEYIHIGVGLPWWATIIATTVLFRMLMMPLVVRGQVNAARLNNVMPELNILTEHIREVANSQDKMKQAETSRELQNFFIKHQCHPLKSLIIPLVQGPVFVSFFLSLRKMAQLPVESMQSGGVLWFTDLTLADPYFILPILSSASMLLTIEVGAEAGVSNPQFKNVKQVFRVMAILMLPLMAKFPAAVFTYWMTSNIFSLCQMLFLRIEKVRSLFGIPRTIDHSHLKPNAGGFFQNLKAGYKNAQNLAAIKHNQQQKEKAFDQAFKRPLQQTYEHNPLALTNEQLFKTASKQSTKKRRNRKDKENYTNHM